jgi:ATP-dependent protease ClpP protease subunit
LVLVNIIAHCFEQKYEFLFNYHNFCTMVGKIIIQGAIGKFEGEKSVELIDVISQVRKQPDATSFDVYINSDGGHVDVGFDIYNFLKSLGVPINTIGQGMVASIATVIFMAGDKRKVMPNTQFMIHAPMISVEMANADEMEFITKDIKETENKLTKFYSQHLNLNTEAINPLLKKDTYLTESQLIDLGFVTQERELQLVARVSTNKNNNKKMSKPSKLQAILNILKGEAEIVNKVVYTADEKEINFPDLSEEDAILIGAKATVDGVPAEGEIVSADGTTYVFVGGILEEIKEATDDVESEVSEEEMVDALIQTLEVATSLEERVNAMETQLTGVVKERNDFEAKLKVATETIAKLKGTSTTVVTDPVDKTEKTTTTSSVVAQWKKNKTNKK